MTGGQSEAIFKSIVPMPTRRPRPPVLLQAIEPSRCAIPAQDASEQVDQIR